MFALNRTANKPLPFYTHPAHSILNSTLPADIACQTEADQVGLRGVFVAAVAGPRRSLQRIIERQRKSRMPVINTKVGGGQ